MKTIIIDNQEYELVPIAKYKAGDWIIFDNRDNKELRRIATAKEYSGKRSDSEDLTFNYGNWMTDDAAKTYSSKIVRKANQKEIEDHLTRLARDKGFKADIRLKGIGKDNFHKAVQNTIDYFIDDDVLSMSGMIIYKDGKWAEIEKEPIFTFGGYPVEFDVITSHSSKKEVTITCQAVTGTAAELANILTHFFRPMPFGNVVVKNWKLKGDVDPMNTIKSFEANDNSVFVQAVTIGCIHGEYSELVAIYKQSQEILKNWKPANNFDK